MSRRSRSKYVGKGMAMPIGVNLSEKEPIDEHRNVINKRCDIIN
ncbi:hypothetical protein [Calothrix sp. NIES-2098]|nr:hypothetical protein NIES2098_45950 [Calothrix sp. NIES-2098]